MHFSSPGLCQVWAGLSSSLRADGNIQPWSWSGLRSSLTCGFEATFLDVIQMLRFALLTLKSRLNAPSSGKRVKWFNSCCWQSWDFTVDSWVGRAGARLPAMPLHHHANLRQGDLADARRMFFCSAFVCFGGEHSENNQRLWKAFSPLPHSPWACSSWKTKIGENIQCYRGK